MLRGKEVIKDDGWEEAVEVETDNDIEDVLAKDLFCDDSKKEFPLIRGEECRHRSGHRVHPVSLVVILPELLQDLDATIRHHFFRQRAYGF